MSPFSWKYFTNGAAFCLKFISLLWVAFRLSSGRPCCSARFNNLSLSLWLAQARNTTKSGVQICGEHQTGRYSTYQPMQVQTIACISFGSVVAAVFFAFFVFFFTSTFPGLSPHNARSSHCHCNPSKGHTPTHMTICSDPLMLGEYFLFVLKYASWLNLEYRPNFAKGICDLILEGRWLLGHGCYLHWISTAAIITIWCPFKSIYFMPGPMLSYFLW